MKGKGRYTYAANFCVRRIMKYWKIAFAKGKRKHTHQFEYDSEFIDFTVYAVITFKKNSHYGVDGYTYEGTVNEPAHMLVLFNIDPDWLPEYWSEIYFDLCDVIRHEMEHMTQSGWNEKSRKYIKNDVEQRDAIDSGSIERYKYLLLPKEIDANLQGMAFRARKQRKPFISVINQYLDRLGTNEIERQEVLESWRSRSKRIGSLPKF